MLGPGIIWRTEPFTSNLWPELVLVSISSAVRSDTPGWPELLLVPTSSAVRSDTPGCSRLGEDSSDDESTMSIQATLRCAAAAAGVLFAFAAVKMFWVDIFSKFSISFANLTSTYETSFTMRGATGISLQPHQILRLPRKMNVSNDLRHI